MNARIDINKYLDDLLLEELPKRLKKRQKIDNEKFEELESQIFIDSNLLLEYDFNIPQLKRLNKKNYLKISGNKTQLIKRIYNYRKYSKIVGKIQRWYRNILIERFNTLKGPALLYREKCINKTDFLSMDDCKEIGYDRFFSYKDEDNKIWGFDLISIYTLYVKKKKEVKNPYTTKILPFCVFENLKKIIKFNKILSYSIDLTLNHNEVVLSKQILEMRVLSLFQEMDSLDNYTQIEWLLSLNKNLLLKFIVELYDIWTYIANLSINSKREICPPLGQPFRNINFTLLSNQSQNQILKTILPILEQLVKTGINRDARILGTYYILSSLTLVNQDAAESMPWLYQSVLGNN